MRRPLAALVLGAVSLAGLVPAAGAAGAADLPKFPFFHRKPVLKLACDIVRADAAAPAVSCSWSVPPSPTAADIAPFEFRLGRIGGGDGRTIVYKGGGTTFVDTSVEQDHRYGYRVQAFTANGRHVASSRMVKVAVPDPAPDHLRLDCSAEQRTAADNVRAHPVVACKWSASERSNLDHYRLLRLDLNEKSWRQVVYRGKDTSFVDEKVRAGHHYKYLVQAVDHRGHIIGTSDVADVTVPPIVIVDPPCWASTQADDAKSVAICAPNKPQPVPGPKPEPTPAPKPRPFPEPKPGPKPEPLPTPEPRPETKPAPLPAPKPQPRPEPKPVPLPEPKPAPVPARMKLACAPQRMNTTTNTADVATKDPAFAPVALAVACEWAAPADLKVAGYQLWRAERPNGTKQVVFKSTDATRYLDRAVSSGHSYLYVVRALDANGRVIAHSDGVTVSFPPIMTADAGAAA
jgi:hypothetical protein